MISKQQYQQLKTEKFGLELAVLGYLKKTLDQAIPAANLVPGVSAPDPYPALLKYRISRLAKVGPAGLRGGHRVNVHFDWKTATRSWRSRLAIEIYGANMRTLSSVSPGKTYELMNCNTDPEQITRDWVMAHLDQQQAVCA